MRRSKKRARTTPCEDRDKQPAFTWVLPLLVVAAAARLTPLHRRRQSTPIDQSELTFLTVDTHRPYMTDFDGADAGKAAHDMLRWVSTTGEKGSWSETASATLGAYPKVRLGRTLRLL